MKTFIDNLCWVGGLVFCALSFMDSCQAQITSDHSTSTQVSHVDLDSKKFLITGGKQVEGNLFHSFSEFSVPEGGSVFFDNSSTVENIFSRVTGGIPSQIEGLIQANSQANLFLLNPSGIIFGPQAQLNIGGSFIATTANQINFADGFIFSATDDRPLPPLLTASIPIGLQFRERAERIVNQSIIQNVSLVPSGLEVNPGKTIALVGGDVLLDGGSLTAPGGRIVLGSVAAHSWVGLSPDNAGWTFNYDRVNDFRDIQLNGSPLNATNLSGVSGTILLQGQNIIITNNSQVFAINFSDTQSGKPIRINAAETLEVSEASSVNTNTFSTQSSGDISVEAKRLVVRNASFIDASSQPSGVSESGGGGGNLKVNASDSIEIVSSRLTTSTFTAGKGGDLTVTTPRLILQDEGQISSESKLSSGNGGSIEIKTGRLVIQNGGVISVAVSEGGSGRAGSLSIIADEFLSLDGVGSSLLTTSDSSKPAGDLTIKTPQLTLQNGALISASSVIGQGGNITLQGLDTLQVNDSTITASTQSGQAGSLTITAAQSVQLNGVGGLSVSAIADGIAGNLTVETDQMNISKGAKVTVSSPQGQAGNLKIIARSLTLDQGAITAETGKSGVESGANITLQIADLLLLENESLISATATGNANGGNIDIDTLLLTVFPPSGSHGSDIIAKAERGNGGSITINAQGVFGIAERPAILGDESNDIDASSEFGASGQVQINSTLDPNRGVIQLPETVVDPNDLIAQHPCRRGNQSQFTRTGRGGLPPSPKEDLSSLATQVGLVEPAPIGVQGQGKPLGKTQPTTAIAPAIVPTQGWIWNAKGEVVLVAYDPTITGSQRLRINPEACPGQ